MSAGGASSPRWDELKKAASAVRARSHAPYSNYRVGAALQSRSGEVFVGTNVENASYGLCLCAERSAVAAAIAAGASRFVALSIISSGSRAAPPCGMCRQVLAEFGPSFPIRCYAEDSDDELSTSVEALLPHAFDGRFLTS